MVEKLNRKDKIYLFVFAAFDELIDKGLLEGQKFLTPKGKRMFRELKKQKFQPTRKEMEDATDTIIKKKP